MMQSLEIATLVERLQAARRVKAAAKQKLEAEEQEFVNVRHELADCQVMLTAARRIFRKPRAGRLEKQRKIRQAKLNKVINLEKRCKDLVLAMQDQKALIQRQRAEWQLMSRPYYNIRDELFAAVEQQYADSPQRKITLMLLAGIPEDVEPEEVRFYEVYNEQYVDVHLHYRGEDSPGGFGDGHYHVREYPDGIVELLYGREPQSR